MSNFKDIKPPKINKTKGSLHPINQTKELIIELLIDEGFEIIRGPEIETEEFNFDMLNIKKSHPARQMHDTFYIDDTHVLRTHTSGVQVRTMETREPPLRVICPGRVYRCD